MIDSHQHFWQYDPIRDKWITDDMKNIRRDFMPSDLSSILNENDIEGCIAVQAAQSYEENDFLLDIANNYSFVKGVVGWVDFFEDKLESRLDFLSSLDKFCGFRHIVQAEPLGFLNKKDFLKGIGILKKYKFTYDILVYHHQLSDVINFVAKFPDQSFVLDHLGKPPVANQIIEPWKSNIKQLSDYPNVYCKLSGLFTEAAKDWSYESVLPYMELVLDYFGSDRLMYGSDWPVCLLSTDYKQQLSVVLKFVEKLSDSEKIKIMSSNAKLFYSI